jgi:hypothetical protein
MQRNAADDVELAVADHLQAERQREESRDLKVQLGSYEGRKFVWSRLERCGVFHDVMGDVETVFRFLGRRSEGLELIAKCQQHPDLFMQMWTEALKRRRQTREASEVTRKEMKKKMAA